MSMQSRPAGGVRGFAALALDYPMSLGVFDSYLDAQKAVDTLSDHQFPVQNCLIVGTELRQLERVTGRMTWGRALVGGALSGVWLGLFVGLIFALFDNQNNPFALALSTMVFGAIFGAVWAAIGYAMARGQRDFTSVSQVVPSRFEVLVEHKFAQQAREILTSAGLARPGGFSSVPSPPAGQLPTAESAAPGADSMTKGPE